MSWNDIIKPSLIFWFYLFFSISTVFLAKLFWKFFYFVAEF